MFILDLLLCVFTAISNNVVGSKQKAKRQDRKVMWDFFLNKFVKTSYASPGVQKIYDGKPFG